MKIIKIKYVCPKCKKVYENEELLSYNSHMAKAAKSFVKNNKNMFVCENCKTPLVQEELLKYYNNDGEFSFTEKRATLQPKKEFDLYNELVKKLVEIKVCTQLKTLVVEGCVENVTKEKTFISNHVKIGAIINNEIVPLFNIVLGEVEYATGSRYTSFYVDLFSKTNLSFLKFLTYALKQDLMVKIVTNQTIDFDKPLQQYTK